jgi:ribosomal protein L11 methyltransferase
VEWLKLTIRIPDDYQESFIAELLDLDFEGFEQFDDKIEAYIPVERFNDVNREYIEQLLTYFPFDGYIEMEQIEQKNWNESWEKTIEPQTIGAFFVKPTWSDADVPPGLIPLEIDPKMAFGTGYHATTRLILEILPQLDPSGKSVLDAGTGTGILAIASVKLGAARVLAFDIDEWSKTNAGENARLNRVAGKIDILLGGFEVIPEKSRYDLILANINRNVIIGMMGEFAKYLAPDGRLCLSGILKTDVDDIIAKAGKHALKVITRKDKGEWSMLLLTKTPGT